MNEATQTEARQIADSLTELVDEIDLASDEDATAEEIQDARSLADEVLGRYRDLLTRVDGDDKTELQRSIGLKVAKVEGLLTRLPSP